MIYLASASPRRSELLAQAGVEFETVIVDVDEAWDGRERAGDYVNRLAREKAVAGLERVADVSARVVGADTAVVIDNRVLGKPRDRDEAVAMLTMLSGRCHRVCSGVALAGPGSINSAVNISRVSFRPMTRSEIEDYWETGEPAGKAGAYAIQGLGARFIERLEGSYSGVMGLPLFETIRLLDAAGAGVVAPGKMPA